MDCNHTRKKLSAYFDDELSFKERELVEKHLALCPACADEKKSLLLISSLMDGIANKDITPYFAQKVVSSATEDLISHHKNHILKPALAGFGILMILLLGIFEFRPMGITEPVNPEYLRDFGDFPPESFTDLYISSIKGSAR
jgi:hypothetical protein